MLLLGGLTVIVVIGNLAWLPVVSGGVRMSRGIRRIGQARHSLRVLDERTRLPAARVVE